MASVSHPPVYHKPLRSEVDFTVPRKPLGACVLDRGYSKEQVK